MRWSEDDNATLARSISKGLELTEIAQLLGRKVGAVRNHASKAGLLNSREWSEEQIAILREAYKPGVVVDVSAISKATRKTAHAVFIKASRLGLGDASRRVVAERKCRNKFATSKERSEHMSAIQKQLIAQNGHPRRMAGKKHSDETKQAISRKSIKHWASLTSGEKSAHTEKAMRAKVAKHGTGAGSHAHGSWKAAWREIGGKRKFFRSRWEANYARYLEWLKLKGEILEWQHEPETFWFESIKRGVRSYLPDFRVWEKSGGTVLHEVKGWMDARSKTTIKRMRKYYPQEKLIVVDGAAYRAIRLKVMRMIPDWEDASRDSHV